MIDPAKAAELDRKAETHKKESFAKWMDEPMVRMGFVCTLHRRDRIVGKSAAAHCPALPPRWLNNGE